MTLDNELIIKEIQSQTKTLCRVEMQVSLLAQNQQILRDMVERQAKKLYSWRQTFTAIGECLKYLAPTFGLLLYSHVNPTFAAQIYQFMKGL